MASQPAHNSAPVRLPQAQGKRRLGAGKSSHMPHKPMCPTGSTSQSPAQSCHLNLFPVVEPPFSGIAHGNAASRCLLWRIGSGEFRKEQPPAKRALLFQSGIQAKVLERVLKPPPRLLSQLPEPTRWASVSGGMASEKRASHEGDPQRQIKMSADVRKGLGPAVRATVAFPCQCNMDCLVANQQGCLSVSPVLLCGASGVRHASDVSAAARRRRPPCWPEHLPPNSLTSLRFDFFLRHLPRFASRGHSRGSTARAVSLTALASHCNFPHVMCAPFFSTSCHPAFFFHTPAHSEGSLRTGLSDLRHRRYVLIFQTVGGSPSKNLPLPPAFGKFGEPLHLGVFAAAVEPSPSIAPLI